jgi:hypothetical protein
VKVCVQLWPPSEVTYTRESVPGPIERITAFCASKASMSRNCNAEVPGGGTFCHVAPRSTVRSTVPRLPLAHATSALTAERPRNPAVEPVGVSRQA